MSRSAVERVAVLLAPVLDQLVLVGGCATTFLVPPPHDRVLRQTDDVDFIIPAFSYGEFAQWESRLRELGFWECREDGVICRWMIGDTRVDFMPVELMLAQEKFELDRSSDLAQALREGEAKGKAEGKAEVAVRLLKRGFQLAEVSELTGLTTEQLSSLAE